MSWKISAGIALLLFAGAFTQGAAGNISAMIAAFCAAAGWGVAAMEERKNGRSAALEREEIARLCEGVGNFYGHHEMSSRTDDAKGAVLRDIAPLIRARPALRELAMLNEKHNVGTAGFPSGIWMVARGAIASAEKERAK